jgi:hypothetical protein
MHAKKYKNSVGIFKLYMQIARFSEKSEFLQIEKYVKMQNYKLSIFSSLSDCPFLPHLASQAKSSITFITKISRESNQVTPRCDTV